LFASSLACAILSSVWVVIFTDETILSIIDSSVHGATFATTAAISGAINELLLGEGVELLMGNEVGTFESTGGGESPA
jgi:hypothetical protein